LRLQSDVLACDSGSGGLSGGCSCSRVFLLLQQLLFQSVFSVHFIAPLLLIALLLLLRLQLLHGECDIVQSGSGSGG
jgi:hypothetical protein